MHEDDRHSCHAPKILPLQFLDNVNELQNLPFSKEGHGKSNNKPFYLQKNEQNSVYII